MGLRRRPGVLRLGDKLVKLLDYRLVWGLFICWSFSFLLIRFRVAVVGAGPVAEAGLAVAGPNAQADEAMGPDGARVPPPGRALRPVEVGPVVVLAGTQTPSVDAARIARPYVAFLRPVPRASPVGVAAARPMEPAGLARLASSSRTGGPLRPVHAVARVAASITAVARAAPGGLQIPVAAEVAATQAGEATHGVVPTPSALAAVRAGRATTGGEEVVPTEPEARPEVITPKPGVAAAAEPT